MKFRDGRSYDCSQWLFGVDETIPPSPEFFSKEGFVDRFNPLKRIFAAIKKNAPLTQFLGQPACVDLLLDTMVPKEAKAKKLLVHFGDKQTLKTLVNYMLCVNVEKNANSGLFAFQAFRLLNAPTLLQDAFIKEFDVLDYFFAIMETKFYNKNAPDYYSIPVDNYYFTVLEALAEYRTDLFIEYLTRHRSKNVQRLCDNVHSPFLANVLAKLVALSARYFELIDFLSINVFPPLMTALCAAEATTFFNFVQPLTSFIQSSTYTPNKLVMKYFQLLASEEAFTKLLNGFQDPALYQQAYECFDNIFRFLEKYRSSPAYDAYKNQMYTNRTIPSVIESPHVSCCYRGFIVLINLLQFSKELTSQLLPSIVKLYFKFPKSTVLMYRVATFLAHNAKNGDAKTFLAKSKLFETVLQYNSDEAFLRALPERSSYWVYLKKVLVLIPAELKPAAIVKFEESGLSGQPIVSVPKLSDSGNTSGAGESENAETPRKKNSLSISLTKRKKSTNLTPVPSPCGSPSTSPKKLILMVPSGQPYVNSPVPSPNTSPLPSPSTSPTSSQEETRDQSPMRRGVIVTTWQKKEVDKEKDTIKRRTSTGGRRSSPSTGELASSGGSSRRRDAREAKLHDSSGGQTNSSDGNSPRTQGSSPQDSHGSPRDGEPFSYLTHKPLMGEFPIRTDSFGNKLPLRGPLTNSTNNTNFDKRKVTGDDTLPSPPVIIDSDNSRNGEGEVSPEATQDLVAALKSNSKRNSGSDLRRKNSGSKTTRKNSRSTMAGSARASNSSGLDSPAPERTEESKAADSPVG